MTHCDDGGCPRALQGNVARSVDYSSCVAAHAELNCLLQSAPADRDGAAMYCTDLPCWDCARAIANSGIVRVVAAGGMYDSWPTTAAFLADAGIATGGPAATTPVDAVSQQRWTLHDATATGQLTTPTARPDSAPQEAPEDDVDEALLNALNGLSDDLGLLRLDEVLANPEQHTYQPEPTCACPPEGSRPHPVDGCYWHGTVGPQRQH